MAGASLKVEWNAEDLKRVNEVFARLIRQVDDLTPLYRDIGEYLLPAHKDRIAQGISPDGTAFAPLSEDYKTSDVKTRSRGADKILILNDYLHGDLAYQVSDTGLELGTNTEYGASHQFGNQQQIQIPEHSRRITQAFGKPLKYPVYQTVGAHSVTMNIPARPFLGFSAADIDEIEQIARDFLADIEGQ